MSVSDVMASIADVQSRIAQLQAMLQTPSAASASVSSAGASTFGTALADASADSSGSDTGSVTGADVVADAKRYLGVPYVLGGESTTGMDCSGLVQKVYSDLGVTVPRLVHEQKTIGTEVASLKDAQPGDLVVLNGGDHIAIWAGNGQVIHAPYEGRTVSLQKAWFTDKDVVTIRRVVPAEAPAATSTSSVDALLDADAGSSDATGSSSLSSLLTSMGAGGATSSTAQQLLAARAALLTGGSA